MITAPSFMAARMTSHSGATLPSISSTRSPRLTPRPRSQLATCPDRAAISAYVMADVAAVVGHDAQRDPVRVLGGDHVEPVERPVELVKLGPGEFAPGGVVVVPQPQQQVSRGPERLSC